MALFHVMYHFGSLSSPGADGVASGATVQTRLEAHSREQALEGVAAQLSRPTFIVETTQQSGVLIQSSHVRFVEIRDLRSAAPPSAAPEGSPRIAAIPNTTRRM